MAQRGLKTPSRERGGEGGRRRWPPTPERGRTDRLLRVDEAADLLGVKPATLYQWTYQRRIPVVKLMGRALRFRESDLQKLIAEGMRPALWRRERP
jgi:excisionase family DNA binding protein